MSEKPPDPEISPTSEDGGKLYSQARIPGTRYWDFSASRKEVQGQFRDRIEREHAQRAGAEPSAPSKRSAMEQIRVAQFQSAPHAGLDHGMEFESQVRNGWLHAPEPVIPLHASEMRALLSHDLSAGHVNGHLPISPVASSYTAAPPEDPSTRWYALHSVFAPSPAITAPPGLPPGFAQHPPAVVVFSLAGGVGKTCLVATLGRTLSALGEKILLADTASGGVLPFYFGSRECKPGVVRTFSPPSFPSIPTRPEDQVPVQLLNLESERFPCYENGPDLLLGKLLQDARGVGRVLIDLATASREVNRRLLALDPIVLVPILPDINSVASLPSLESSFAGHGPDAGKNRVFYLLNQFDISSALHRDMRNLLQLRLGEQLLPFVLQSSSMVNEAAAEGMTVMDYAPESAIAEDYRALAGWLVRIAAPAIASTRGARWRER